MNWTTVDMATAFFIGMIFAYTIENLYVIYRIKKDRKATK